MASTVAAWPMVALGRLLRKNEDWIAIDPDKAYAQVTVRLWGKGVALRGNVLGAEIAASRQCTVHHNQFILSRIDARNGAFGLVPAALEGAVVSNDFPAFDLDETQILPTFLEWMSKTHDFVDLCKRASEGTTNRVRLKEERFLAMPIPLPPLDEQRRIVARIEALAARIEQARGLRREAMAEAEALLTSTGRAMLAAVNAPNTPLRNWLDTTREGIQTGPFGAQLSSTDFTSVGVPVLTIGNVQFGGLAVENIRCVTEAKAAGLPRFKLQEGDLLFARMGTVGRCCIVPAFAEGWLINYHIIRVALDRNRVEPRYIHWSIRVSTDVERYLDEKTRGATRAGVNSTIVGDLPCRVPSLPEQQCIVAYLDDVQARVEALKQAQAETQAELAALLPSVLDRAFRGEL